jgi:antirestriction protein ArdC
MSDKKDIAFEIINERIDALLAEGVVPWRKPWTGAANHPRSVEGRPYSGINAFLLGLMGFDDPRFITPRKAVEMGGTIIKGSKTTPVVFWKRLTYTDKVEKDGVETEVQRHPMFLRYYNVLNVSQIEDLPIKPLPQAPAIEEFDPIEAVDKLIEAMPNRPELRYVTGDRAYYEPIKDRVTLPKRGQFESAIGLAEALVHEHSHATGHASRLGRDTITGTFDHFGSDRYGREELTVAFATGYVFGELGIEAEGLPSIAAYIANWRDAIKADPKALVVAAGRGAKAAEYLLGRSEPVQQDQEAIAA